MNKKTPVFVSVFDLKELRKEHTDNPLCCHKCFERAGLHVGFMLVCPVCGNKRCPKATDHNLECTRSNKPGQAGSIYA